MRQFKFTSTAWNSLLLIISVAICLALLCIYSTVGVVKTAEFTGSSNPTYNATFLCADRPLESSVEEKGNYLVYYNIIRADRRFRCDESVTITTIGDYTFLDNLVPLVERWRGPISVALYSPGYDFVNTVLSINHLRRCASDLVQELVTFHLYLERNHLPQLRTAILPYIENILLESNSIDCRLPPAYRTVHRNYTYRSVYNLQFGINLGRNVARRGAQTHYFLATDLELYPSEGLIQHFLRMVRFSPGLQVAGVAFALPIFEVRASLPLPATKRVLQQMLAQGEAAIFHVHYCSVCHTVPKSGPWMESKAPPTGQITEFTRDKRKGSFYQWEPFLIETHADPMHDERLYWDGAGDKMVQAYAMCLLDYDFVVLENAFLVHKAGIKQSPPQSPEDRLVSKEIMENLIKPELDALYGYREGCAILPIK